jgi:hypothetical protein
MKIIITESQHKRLFEEEQKVLHLPSAKVFGGWDELQRYLELKGNPLYSLGGDLDLQLTTSVKSLGNLVSVDGDLVLDGSEIESLGNLTHVGGTFTMINTPIKTLGNLTSVGRSLFMNGSEIESFGNLTSVGSNMFMRETPIDEKYSEEQIRQMIYVGNTIYS